MQTALKTKQQEGCTQFQITSDLLRNLYKFDLTPVTKLVLLELTTHLNESKNGSVVFPSVGYVAEVLGIGLTAAKKAINDLIKEGLIIKSKRDKVRGNYNKYLLTLKVRNLTSERSENELFKQSESDLFMITNKKEQKKEQTVKSGENVYRASEQSARAERSHVYHERSLTGDDLILYEYAKKKAKYNVDALIKKIKENGGDKKIIKEYKQKRFITQRAENAQKETESLLKLYASYEKDAVMPETCTAWVELGKKLGIQKKL